MCGRFTLKASSKDFVAAFGCPPADDNALPLFNIAPSQDVTVVRETGTTHENGTVFRILELQPGNTPRVHRTDSLDYAVIMKGEIDMELETGEITHLKAGDVIVQRGTVHNWINNGTEPCVIAFVLIAAKPVEIGGKVLNAFG